MEEIKDLWEKLVSRLFAINDRAIELKKKLSDGDFVGVGIIAGSMECDARVISEIVEAIRKQAERRWQKRLMS